MGAPSLGPCRGCGADMLWVATVNGKMQPLDPEPDAAEGSVIVVAADVEVEGQEEPVHRLALAASYLTEKGRQKAAQANVRLYTPHHMTCPKNQDRRFNRGG